MVEELAVVNIHLVALVAELVAMALVAVEALVVVVGALVAEVVVEVGYKHFDQYHCLLVEGMALEVVCNGIHLLVGLCLIPNVTHRRK